MAKTFLDVFPDLHIAEDLKELLNLVEVERVTSNRDRSSVRIYIVSPRLIHKKTIFDLEKGIRDQLFPGKQLTVKIMEKYRLSRQYTPEKLLDVYRDSLLLELKNYSIIEYTILRKAKCTFPQQDLLRMTVEDTMVNREKSAELKRVLEKIFHERCGLPVEICFQYVEPKENKLMKQKQLQLSREVMEITMRSAVGSSMTAHSALNSGSTVSAAPGPDSGSEQLWEMTMSMAADSYVLPDGNQEPPWEEPAAQAVRSAGAGEKKGELSNRHSGKKLSASGKASRGSAASAGNRDGFRKAYRRSENPDVLYGKDFEGDATEIDKIDGAIGETILRGKIIHKDSRELRSGKTMFMLSLIHI